MKNYYNFLGLKNKNVSKDEIRKALKKKKEELGVGPYGAKNMKLLQTIENTLLNDYERGKYDARYLDDFVPESSMMTMSSPFFSNDFTNLFNFNSRIPSLKKNQEDFFNDMTINTYSQHASSTPEGGYVVYSRETSTKNGKMNKDIQKKVTYDKNKKKIQQKNMKNSKDLVLRKSKE